MILAGITAIAAVLLNIVVILSADPITNLTKMNWSYGVENDPCSNGQWHKIYVGVLEFETVLGNKVTLTQWSSDNCTAKFYNQCRDTMAATLAFALLCFALSLPSICLNCSRANEGYYCLCADFCGIVLSFLAMVCGVIAVASYSEGCHKTIIHSTSSFTWHYGPAWSLMMSVTGLKFLDFLLNTLFTCAHSWYYVR